MSRSILVAGVDEAGRGPLAGPVVAAAVILPAHYGLPNLTDSKKLSEKRRQTLEPQIKSQALCWAVAEASVEEIDRLNILQASLLAMARAVQALVLPPGLVLVDGNKSPKINIDCQCIIKGDLTEPAISAASILAKQQRDRQLIALDDLYPHYGFARHKAYPTRAHVQALQKHGPCAAHRQTFKPVRDCLAHG